MGLRCRQQEIRRDIQSVVLLVISSLFLLLTGAQTQSRADTVTLQGTVTFPGGEAPLFVTITLGSDTFSKEVGTDANGTYAFRDVPPGVYNLAAFGTGQSKSGMFIQKGIQIKSDTPLPIIIDIVLSEPTPGQ